MRATALLVLAVVAASLCVAAALPRGMPFIGQEAAACHNATSRRMCHQTANCTFCKSTVFPSACYLDSEAKLLPKFAFTCDDEPPSAANPAPGPPGTGCSLKMEKKECGHDKECVWCEGMFGGSCYSKDQAKFLPPGFYHCKKAPSAALLAPPGPPAPGPGCSTATEKKACKKEPGCVWCMSSFGPGSCYSEDQAKFLPAQFFKCTKPSAEDEAVEAVRVLAPPGPPAPGPGCSTATEKKACKKEPGCVWCMSSFGPGSCYSEDQAKFLPAQFFKCTKPSAEDRVAAA